MNEKQKKEKRQKKTRNNGDGGELNDFIVCLSQIFSNQYVKLL